MNGDRQAIEIPSNATREEFLRQIAAMQRGTVQPRTAPPENAITKTLAREIELAIITGVVRELRAEPSSVSHGVLTTLNHDEVTAAAERLQAARKAEGKPLGIMEAAKEVLGDRVDEFMAAERRAMNRPYVERMRAFDRAQASAARAPSLDEREAAVANDPTIHAEAELMASREGIGYLDAVRKIERTRTLEARVAARKS